MPAHKSGCAVEPRVISDGNYCLAHRSLRSLWPSHPTLLNRVRFEGGRFLGQALGHTGGQVGRGRGLGLPWVVKWAVCTS